MERFRQVACQPLRHDCSSRVVAGASGASLFHAQGLQGCIERPPSASGTARRYTVPNTSQLSVLASQLPAGASQLPALVSQLPAGASQLPVLASQFPAGASQLPALVSQLPAGASQLPAGASQLPAIGYTPVAEETTHDDASHFIRGGTALHLLQLARRRDAGTGQD